MTRTLADLVGRIRAGGVVALTGAGVSYESGIPTFRGRGGLWERYNPGLFATWDGLVSVLRDRPLLMRDFIREFYAVLLEAQPNPAHLALAGMEKRGLLQGVITQNIDGLHRAAGSRKVFELHGNAFRLRCGSCGSLSEPAREFFRTNVNFAQRLRTQAGVLRLIARLFPRCRCKGRLRTDVVLFGEELPHGELAGAYGLLERTKTLLVVGCSLSVYPAASLPVYAARRGAAVAEINSESPGAGTSDFTITGRAGDILPQVLEALIRD